MLLGLCYCSACWGQQMVQVSNLLLARFSLVILLCISTAVWWTATCLKGGGVWFCGCIKVSISVFAKMTVVSNIAFLAQDPFRLYRLINQKSGTTSLVVATSKSINNIQQHLIRHKHTNKHKYNFTHHQHNPAIINHGHQCYKYHILYTCIRVTFV